MTPPFIRRLMLVVLTLGFMAFAATPQAFAAPQQRLRFEQIHYTTLRDAGTDIVLSDGRGPYASSSLESSYIRNLIPSVVDDDVNTLNQDRLFVKTSPLSGSRAMSLSSSLASIHHNGLGAERSIDCVSTHLLFESASTPDWWEAIQSVGDSVRGWGNVRCYTTADENHGYQVVYHSTLTLAGPGECLTITRTGSTTLVLDADSGVTSPLTGEAPCNGEVQSFEYTTDGSGQRTGFTATSLGFETAPFEVTLELARRKGKP